MMIRTNEIVDFAIVVARFIGFSENVFNIRNMSAELDGILRNMKMIKTFSKQ
jgi:hypothetical protein